jgi:hypothetical protein
LQGIRHLARVDVMRRQDLRGRGAHRAGRVRGPRTLLLFAPEVLEWPAGP